MCEASSGLHRTSRTRAHEWNRDRERGSVPQFALGRNRRAVILRYDPRDGEAEPGSAHLSRTDLVSSPT